MLPAAFIALASAFGVAVVSAQNGTTYTTGQLGNATVVENSPMGVTYEADLGPNALNVTGSVKAEAGEGGRGVKFTVNFADIPKEGGPFVYHIHAFPINSTGSCASALAHLDPFIRGEQPPCDPSLPETCQVGDLSGKYGKVTSDPYSIQYTDLYNSIEEGPGSFFGNRSIVFHFANATRIACANFKEVSSNGTKPNNDTSSATPTTTVITVPTTAAPTQATFTGAANSYVAGAVNILGAAVAAALLL